MSEFAVDPTSDEGITKLLFDAMAKRATTPIALRFFKATTDADLVTYNTNFPAKIAEMNTADGLKISSVEACDISFGKLRNKCSHYLQTVNFHIVDGDYPASVHTYFLMTAGSEVLPDMASESDLINVANKIASGDAQLVLDGLVPPFDFSAAEVAALLADFLPKRATKNTNTNAFKDLEIEVATMRAICVTLCVTIREECEFHYKDNTESAMRDYCRLWGIVFDTTKTKTLVSLRAAFAGTLDSVVGMNFRIGQVDTKKTKKILTPALQGASGITNAHGVVDLETTQTGDLFLIGELATCVKSITPITIVAGTDQSLTVLITLL